MSNDNKLVKYNNYSIKKLGSIIWDKIKRKIGLLKYEKNNFENEIITHFPDKAIQEEVTSLLKEYLSRNNDLLETLDIRMLSPEFVNLFSKTRLERIITDSFLQKNILELSHDELQTYSYILNYDLVNFNNRIGNLYPHSCKNFNVQELENLNEQDKLKAISIILSNSEFDLSNLSELSNYYEKRKTLCKQIIDDPQKIDEEYDKDINSEMDISDFPFGLLYEMHSLSTLDRIKYAIIAAKYGMNLEKAKILCNAFGSNIDQIEQSEGTRIIKELKNILEENNIDNLKQIDLEENYANYEGTINIVPNLKNAYLSKYQETLYQINEKDYIGTQKVRLKGKKHDVKIYNVLGKNNDNANFNMILTSLGGIFVYNHDYSDLKADWDRATKHHSISCSYIGNDFLGVVDESFLLAFSDIQENELLQARNQDAGTADFPFETLNDLEDNLFLTPKNQINSSKIYNELLVERKIEKDGKLVNRSPTFAVFIAETIDDINDNKNYRWKEAKRLAAELDIPIAVIDGTQCTKLEFEKVQEMVKIVKETKNMNLIPEIIHKIENNRAAQLGILKNVRNEIFSSANVNKFLEEIIGAIITSDISAFNQGIKAFEEVTKEIKDSYINQSSNTGLEKCKTYDYDKYLDRLKILFDSRNGTGSPVTKETGEKIMTHEEEVTEIVDL